jgi:hypothetical protein
VEPGGAYPGYDLPAGRVLVASYNGVYRAVIVTPPSGFTGTWVVVPQLNGNEPMGPCDTYVTLPASPVTHRVLVATIAGVKDDLAIIAVV